MFWWYTAGVPHELALYITKYGYLAIFSLVFSQEIGIPNPIPNELVILFSGYLTSVGLLSFPLVFLTVVAGDFVGTSVLYFVFHFFGDFLLLHKPKWIPISHAQIDKLGERISKKGRWGIFVGRLLPYVRGYTSVAAGLLHISPRVFLTTVIFSAIIWSGGYATIGKFIGKHWNGVAGELTHIRTVMLAFFGALLVITIVRNLKGERERNGEAK